MLAFLLYLVLCGVLGLLVRVGVDDRDLEIAVLRRQLSVLNRRGTGRPPIDPGVRDLILRMARENPRWCYLRIKGELLKLGLTVSATTIANVLRRGGLGPAPRRIGPTWSEFLRAQAFAILATSAPGFGPEWDRGRQEQARRLPEGCIYSDQGGLTSGYSS